MDHNLPNSSSGAGASREDQNIENSPEQLVELETDSEEEIIQAEVKSSSTSEPTEAAGASASPAVAVKQPVQVFKEILPPLLDTDPIVHKSYSLAKFIVRKIGQDENVRPKDEIEKTLLRVVNLLVTDHTLIFQSVIKDLDVVTRGGYETFVTVADELFEQEKKEVTWNRIVVCFAFGAHLTKLCAEKNEMDYANNAHIFLGRYIATAAGNFVKANGGWEHLPIEFENPNALQERMFKFCAMTAVSLGMVTAAMFYK